MSLHVTHCWFCWSWHLALHVSFYDTNMHIILTYICNILLTLLSNITTCFLHWFCAKDLAIFCSAHALPWRKGWFQGCLHGCPWSGYNISCFMSLLAKSSTTWQRSDNVRLLSRLHSRFSQAWRQLPFDEKRVHCERWIPFCVQKVCKAVFASRTAHHPLVFNVVHA